MTPRFSVILPAYNRAALIRTALDSVLAQRHPAHEILVVDDGSTDGTPDVVAAYAPLVAPRVTLLRQPNAGPAAARNLAARHATGDYLAFLDSDDAFFPWALSNYAAALSASPTPLAFLTARSHHFTPGQSPLAPETPLITRPYPDFLAASADYLAYSCSAFVVRRDAFAAVGGFDERLRVAEDLDLSLRLAVHPGYVHVDAPPAFAYLEHDTSLKSDYSRSIEGLRRLLAAEAAHAYPGGAARRRERLALLSRALRPHLFLYTHAGHRAAALALYARSLPMHLRLRRFKFLAAFPAYWLASLVLPLPPRRG